MAKALFLDIETVPNKVLAWGLYDQHLGPDNILEERHVLCASWKWLGGKQIRSASILTHEGTEEYPDLGVITKLCELLHSADSVIAHNGDRFDLRWVRGRALILGLPPTPPVTQLDTLKMARKQGYFNCNRLDYLAQILKVGKKVKTDFDLWKRAKRNEEAAIREMVAYNRHDVELLEGVYKKLAPWVAAKMNVALIDDRECCPFCGGEHLKPWSFYYTRAMASQRFVCRDCGHWSHKPLTRGVIR